MKSEYSTISDYFPLCLDIEGCNKEATENPSTINLSADELLEWASENEMTGLQAMTLLIKNAFEGHHCHLNGRSLKRIAREGTIQLDFEEDADCTELACDFFNHLPVYLEGIEKVWRQRLPDHDGCSGTDLLGMLYFSLSNQLFRLPLAYSKEFDTKQFNAVTVRQAGQLRIQYMLQTAAMEHAAHRSFIDIVDNKYADQFKVTLLKLNSKETVLIQLLTKLDYANDPSVKTEEELEKKYFEFLIATNVDRFEKRQPMLSLELKEQQQDHDFKELLKSRIKKLYKTVSKNCSEVHNQLEGSERYQQLKEYFVAASAVYNAFYNDLGNLMLQHSRLMLLMAKVINYRAANQLPVQFIDFAGKLTQQQVELREEDMVLCQAALQRNLWLMRTLHITDYKVKYLRDEEMSKIHQEFLLRQLDYIENRIYEVMDEIKRVMQEKGKTNA